MTYGQVKLVHNIGKMLYFKRVKDDQEDSIGFNKNHFLEYNLRIIIVLGILVIFFFFYRVEMD